MVGNREASIGTHRAKVRPKRQEERMWIMDCVNEGGKNVFVENVS